MKRISGFTLVELLVVISIIGILAALLLANFSGIRDRADDAKLKSNLKQFQTAMRMKYNDDGKYPSSQPGASDLSGYMNTSDFPDITVYTSTTDTFKACIALANTADQDAQESQSRCGLGTSDPGKYCVCNL